MGDPWSRSWPAPETHWHCCHEGWHHHQHWHHQRFLCNQWQDLLFINTLQGHSITISWRLKMCQKILTKIMKDGNIAVSDYDNKWISVHEPNGKFVSKVSFYHNFLDQKIWSWSCFQKLGGNKLLGPKGVAVADSGEIIVIDNKGSAVFILHPASGKVVLESIHLLLKVKRTLISKHRKNCKCCPVSQSIVR